MKLISNFSLIALLALLSLGLSSCEKKNPSGTKPLANFAFKMYSDLTVEFTDNSEDAQSYEWSFGDGQTSTLAAPTHKYSTKQSFTVTLTVTNGDQKDTMTKQVDLTQAPVVDIDGVFTDWDNSENVKARYDYPTTATSLYGIPTMKVTHDANFIYVYAEFIKSVASNMSIYLKVADNPVGQYKSWIWDQPIQNLVQFTGLQLEDWNQQEHQDPELYGLDQDWGSNWPAWLEIVAPGSGMFECSGIVPITKKATFDGTDYDLVAIEISMRRALIPNLSNTGFSIGVSLQDAGWADAGNAPGPGGAGNSLAVYDFATRQFTN